jgi:hypothetical protein
MLERMTEPLGELEKMVPGSLNGATKQDEERA